MPIIVGNSPLSSSSSPLLYSITTTLLISANARRISNLKIPNILAHGLAMEQKESESEKDVLLFTLIFISGTIGLVFIILVSRWMYVVDQSCQV